MSAASVTAQQAPGVLVIVLWEDAHTTGHEELAPDEISDALHFGYMTTSCGILIRSDEKGVSLCSDRQVAPDGTVHYRCAHHIPRGMIIAERTLKEPGVVAPKARKKRAPRKKELEPTLSPLDEAAGIT